MPAPKNGTRFPFTESKLKALRDPPARVKVRYKDSGCPGLSIRAMGKTRAWIYRSKVAGKAIEIRLGAWPAITVEDARRLAKTVAPAPKAAQDAKRAQRIANTVGDAWKALLANPTRRRDGAPLRPATLRSYEAAWEHLKPHVGSRSLTEIDGEAAKSLRTTLLVKHGPAQTRRALALLVVLLGGRMPREANGRVVQKPTMQPRRRFMNPTELGALLRGLDAEPPLWRVFWLCCLLAPLRRGNIASAQWSDLNLDDPARWTVSGEDAKGGKLLAMPIAEPLARILRKWKEENPEEKWVFPAGLTGSPHRIEGPIVSVQHAWARALLLGEAVRLCDAIGPHEKKTGRQRFAAFIQDVDSLRGESWRTARDRKPMKREGSPLVRSVALLREMAKELEIKHEALAMRDLTPHDLRRTAASWAVQAGASMAVVAASLGHADTRVTEAHYGHLSDDPVRRMLADNAGRLLKTVDESE
mgnify:CR=1 FL=1